MAGMRDARVNGRTRRVAAVLGGCAFVAAGLSGCGGDTNGGAANAICREAEDRLRSCSRLTEGVLDCGLLEYLPYGECAIECLRTASCEEIEAQECEDAENAYASCLARCEAPLYFVDCGDGEEVSIDYRCDGDADCANGRDELDCEEPEPTLECGGGERVYPDQRCDGVPDCMNEADERGCPMRAETICPGGF